MQAVISRLHPGDRIFVQHAGKDEWHARIATATNPTASHFTALTPDEDHYVHGIVDEVTAISMARPRGGVPRELLHRRQIVY